MLWLQHDLAYVVNDYDKLKVAVPTQETLVFSL